MIEQFSNFIAFEKETKEQIGWQIKPGDLTYFRNLKFFGKYNEDVGGNSKYRPSPSCT